MKPADELVVADELLVEWHEWSAAYRPSLGAPRVSPYCRESTSSRQWESSTDASCDRLYVNQMRSVAFCVDQLPTNQQCAIGIEMRNRRSTARVWREPTGTAFSTALDAIVPIMRRRGLFD